MNNEQESAMNELLFGLDHEGKKLLENFNGLQEALKFPSGEVGELLERKENLDLSDEELEAKMQEFTEEAADRDYAAAETNEERDAAKFKHMDDAVMYERYSQALDYRKNVEKSLSDFDAQLKTVTNIIEKFNATGTVKKIQTALSEARANREPGNEADMAYINGLEQYLDMYNFYVDICDGMRMMVEDRKAQFDQEFNEKRSAVKTNNDKVNASIEAIKIEIEELEKQYRVLDDEEEFYSRVNDFENPRYIEIINRKKSISSRLSELNNKILEEKGSLQSLPTYDYDFNSYKVGQRDIINLDLGIKRYLAEQSDLEKNMQKHIEDAKNRAPRFEYFIDAEGNLVISAFVNGTTKTKTVGNYKDLKYDDLSNAVRQILVFVAAGTKGLDLPTVLRLDYKLAEKTPDGLEFVESKDMDSFKMLDAIKFISAKVGEKVKEDGVIDDMRNIINEPEPTIEEPEQTVEEPNRDNVPEGAIRVTGARDFKFKVGNDNDLTRKVNPGQNRNYEQLLKDRYAHNFIDPAIAAIGIFAIASVPILPVVLASTGTFAIATIMRHSPEIIEKARMHKLNKLARKAGLSIGYNIDAEHYGMYFVDSEGRALTADEAQEIAGESVDIQAELDKIAGNKFRGKDYRKVYAEKAEKKFENRTIKKIAKYAELFDLKLDEDNLKETGDVRFTDLDGNILSDEELREKVDDLNDFNEDVAAMQKEYQEGMEDIKNDQYYEKLLTSKKARKLNRMSDLKEVTANNLIDLFDDLGGIRLPKKKPNKISKWINKKLEGLRDRLNLEEVEEQVTNDINLDVQEEPEAVQVDNAPEVTEDNITDENVVTDEAVVTDEVVSDEPIVDEPEVPTENAIIESEPVAPETATSEPINSEDLDINEAIVNATTTAAPVIDEEAMEAERAATVQQAMTEDEMSQATAGPTQAAPESNDIQAYMEATIDNVESTLPDLIKANPAEAEKFVINHPEHQELYNSIIASVGSEGLGSK